MGRKRFYLNIDPPVIAEVIMIAHNVAFLLEDMSEGVSTKA